MPLPSYNTLEELIGIYSGRLNRNAKNIERIKRFYHDDESFDDLMNRLIQKDYKRFQKFIDNAMKGTNKQYPSPWKVFFAILEIVQSEGQAILPFDTLTKSFHSRSFKYHGWTFSWVHGTGTLISVFNRNDELVYRF